MSTAEENMSTAEEKKIPKVAVGDPVPDFVAPIGEDRTLQFSHLQGRKVVLYFYPKDDTPGCTSESQDFAAQHAAFQEAGAVIIGASRDSLQSHAKFQSKYELPFELISDPDETLCRVFDVLREKNLYGRTVWGVERSTFLIDDQGVLRREWRGVKVPGHAAEVLEAVKTL